MFIGALRRPDLALRFLAGRMPSEFSLKRVARYVKSTSPTILEAGAFDGRDTERFAQLWPEGIVYAFEPMPSLAAKVREATADLANVVLVEAALGVDDSGSVDLYTFAEDQNEHGSSSILRPGDHLDVAPEIQFHRKLTVRSIMLDEWFSSIERTSIHLMWLDLQGAELKVLERGVLALSKTEVIHIEVSRRPLYEGGATFRQVHRFLRHNGFKLMAARIPVRSGNAIYVRRKR